MPANPPSHRRLVFGRAIDVARLARFGLVSVVATLVDFGIFNLLIIPKLLPPLAATTISYSCGIVASFVLNRWLTFRGRRESVVHEFGMFLLISLVGLALNSGAVALAERAVGRETLLLNMAKLAAGALTWLLKFKAFKHWVFPERGPTAASLDRRSA
jgi:putative flippase GtrA